MSHETRAARDGTGHFGFRSADSYPAIPPAAPLRRFALYCEGCRSWAVTLHLGHHEGEGVAEARCRTCGARERLPARLLGHE